MLAVAVLAVWALLFVAGAWPVEAASPGKNGKIAFARLDVRDSDIFTIRRDGRVPTNLTKSQRTSDVDPAWSPSGKRIVFSRNGDIFVMKADGSRMRRITEGSAGDWSPSWSPSGRRIAFVRQRGEQGSRAVCVSCIYTVRSDGTGLRRLTGTRKFVSDPDWSPDGEKIAFQRGLDVFVMDPADGSGKKNLTRTPRLQESEPDWSPDGRKIAFTSFTEAQGAFDRIFTMDADGTNKKNLKNGVSSPAWSPNGRRIAFVSIAPPENADIFTMKVDGTDVRRLTRSRAFDSAPDWQPLPFS